VQASSTRSALCSNNRITAALRSAAPAGVGVRSGHQGAGGGTIQPDGGGVVRIDHRAHHPGGGHLCGGPS
jgi:hypothetical protein